MEPRNFTFLAHTQKQPSKAVNRGMEHEWRLVNGIGERFRTVYCSKVISDTGRQRVSDVDEWWLRAHMVVDHVSGMTDNYALEIYKLYKGVQL